MRGRHVRVKLSRVARNGRCVALRGARVRMCFALVRHMYVGNSIGLRPWPCVYAYMCLCFVVRAALHANITPMSNFKLEPNKTKVGEG